MANHKVAVIGCGYWGKNLVRNFNALGALGMVCDASESGRATAAAAAPGIALAGAPEEVFRSDLGAVVIATPAETHYDIARQALMAGKDVFVEKPLALRLLQGRELVELAAARKRILMVGHVLEYHPAVSRLIELVREGQLGKVNYVYSNRLNLGKVRREENILWSFAPHDIAVILRLAEGMPLDVVACGANYIQPKIADVTVTCLLFDNGIRAHVFVSWLHPFKEQRVVVIGSERMAAYDDVAKKLVLYDQKVTVEDGMPVPVRGEGREVEFSSEEPLRLECQAFLRAILSRTPPLTDGESGVRTLEVLQAAQRSLSAHGAMVRLPVEV